MIFAGLARLAFLFFVAYGLLLVIIYFYQRNLQYFPSNDMGDERLPDLLKMEIVKYKADDNTGLVSWFAKPKEDGGKIILYFHGNAGNISSRAARAQFFLSRGYGVLLAGYRGYGGNGGNPTEEGLYKDARAAIKFLEERGYKIADIVVYGESLGTGVSVQMATEYQFPRMILEAPFTSAADVAKKAYFFLPVDMLMKDRFDSLAKIGKVKSSLLLVHGDADMAIPHALGKKLYDAANHPKEFITIERGGHNNLFDMGIGDAVAAWIEREPDKKP